MKQYLIALLVHGAVITVCTGSNYDVNSGSNPVLQSLPGNSTRQILNTVFIDNDRLLITTWEQHEISQTRLYILLCDGTGKILQANKLIIKTSTKLKGTDDPAGPVLWLTREQSFPPRSELWLAVYEQGEIRERMVLKDEWRGTSSMFDDCWLLKSKETKKLFVKKAEIKVNDKKNFQMSRTWLLYCYRLNEGHLELLGEPVPIADSVVFPDEVDVECAMVNDEAWVWVCEHHGQGSSEESVLRVAKWADGGHLEWKKCYEGSATRTPFKVDPVYGLAASIFETRKNESYPCGIICQVVGSDLSLKNLGCDFTGEHQFLWMGQILDNWLLSDRNAWNVTIRVLDNQFNEIQRIKKGFPQSCDFALALAEDGSCHSIVLMEDHIEVAKLADLASAPSRKEELQSQAHLAISPELTTFYDSYVEGDGSALRAATNDELIEDVATGGFESSLISYDRLILRNSEASAKAALAKRIDNTIRQSIEESDEMATIGLAFYGEPAVTCLSEIAMSGPIEYRQAAVKTLVLMPMKPEAVDVLLGFLNDPVIQTNPEMLIGVCRIGAAAGKVEAMNTLITLATDDSNKQLDEEGGTSIQTEWARLALMDVACQFDDTPKAWVQEEWNTWLKKHSDHIMATDSTVALGAWSPSEYEQRHKMLLDVAKKLEQLK